MTQLHLSARRWLACLALFAHAGLARAGSVDEHTRGLYERGIAEYRAGDFGAAIASFRDAYAIEPSPQLLFNLAQAHRQRGDVSDALALYREYLRKAPNAAARVDVLALIDRLQAERPTVRRLELPAPPQAGPTQGLLPDPGGEPAREAERAPVDRDARPRISRAGAIALVASTALLGTVALSGAAGLSLRASSQAALLDGPPANATWDLGYQARYDDRLGASRAATALYVIGASTVAVSAISAIVLRRTLRHEGAPPGRLAWAF